MSKEHIVFVYECEWNIRERLIPEPCHPAYKGLYTEGKWCYFFFINEVDEYFRELLRSPPYRCLRFNRRFEFSFEAWQKFTPEVHVGNFRIVSQKSHYSSEKRLIILSPSISFGSGTHPSTQACLLALERVFEKSTPNIVLDVGTGSGILALGALILGAEKVIASDISYLAIREARKNSELNVFSGKLYFLIADGLSAMNVSKIPLVVMNLEWPSLEMVFTNSNWWMCQKIIVGGFPRFYWHKLLRKLELSLFFMEELIWVEDWGAAIIAQRSSTSS